MGWTPFPEFFLRVLTKGLNAICNLKHCWLQIMKCRSEWSFSGRLASNIFLCTWRLENISEKYGPFATKVYPFVFPAYCWSMLVNLFSWPYVWNKSHKCARPWNLKRKNKVAFSKIEADFFPLPKFRLVCRPQMLSQFRPGPSFPFFFSFG